MLRNTFWGGSTTYSRDDLIASLRDVASRLDRVSVSRSLWVRETGINEHHVLKHFDSWNELVRAAGLQADDRSRIADEDLLEAMRAAFLEAGGVVTRTRYRKFSRYSDDVYAKRWGRWQNVLAHFRAWIERTDPEFPFLADLPAETSEAGPGSPDSGAVHSQVWDSMRRTQYGPFLNFRGLQHAPINEQGVVFLFGMVAFDLGYVVEGVGTGFPGLRSQALRQSQRRYVGARLDRV